MSVRETLTEIKSKLTALLTYSNGVTGESDTSIGDAIQTLSEGYGGQSLPISLELVGTWAGYLDEHTSTTAQTINTNISIQGDTAHLYYLATIECDGELDTSNANNWGGVCVQLISKYPATGRFFSAGNIQFRGIDHPVKWSDVAPTDGAPVSPSNYSVYPVNNSINFQFARKAHETNCPVIMGGNYTVNVYGIVFNV